MQQHFAPQLTPPSIITVIESTPEIDPDFELEVSSNLVKRGKDWKDAEKQNTGQDDDLRICFQGVREFMKVFEIVKDLDKLFPNDELGIVAILKEPKRSFFFLRFKDVESKNKFFTKGIISIRNRVIKMKNASLSKGSAKKERLLVDIRKFINKRTEEGKSKVANQDNIHDEVIHTKESIEGILKERVCAYGCKPYQEQLELKQKKLEDYLKEIKTLALGKLKSEEIQTMDWLKSAKETCCELNTFLPCDEKDRFFYRTKTEFTIGYSYLDKLPKVGFNVSNSNKTFHSIELTDTPEGVMTIPEETFTVAKLSESLIRKLEWPLFDRGNLTGFWRFIIVKISKRTHEMMVNFVGNRDYFTEEFSVKFKDQFVDKLMNQMQEDELLRELKHITVVFQHSNSSSDCVPSVEDHELEMFAGERKTYHERMADCMFEVSNSSFLQINIPQSEKMYEYAKKYVSLDEKTILLDICSGIGTIGISVGRDCKKVIGIEMVKSSCFNAIKNAKTNNMNEKYEVIEGKVEDKIEEVAAKYSSEGFRIVGIIDPPRAGLHPDVIRCLRTCKGLDLLVFICCDIKQSKANIIDLCLPQNKKRRGPPFSPILCSGVDMFPQTPHFESLFVLQRLYEE